MSRAEGGAQLRMKAKRRRDPGGLDASKLEHLARDDMPKAAL
jgi:hypothetical protein